MDSDEESRETVLMNKQWHRTTQMSMKRRGSETYAQLNSEMPGQEMRTRLRQ